MAISTETEAADATPVTFYWRPGCGFCTRLAGELDQMGVEVDRRNIWDDPAAAAFVRSVANGNETVPTVVVGPRAMVNPRGRDVATALRYLAPQPTSAVTEPS